MVLLCFSQVLHHFLANLTLEEYTACVGLHANGVGFAPILE